MNLYSIEYFLLLFAVATGLYSIKKKFRNELLLSISLGFYLLFNLYFGIILAICVMSAFLSGRGIANALSENKKKNYLKIGVGINLVLLFSFKYLAFFTSILSQTLGIFKNSDFVNRIILPVGLSYFTFTAIAYLVDVYRGNTGAEKNLVHFSLFIAFFPKVIAGPIERVTSFMPQVKKNHLPKYDDLVEAARLILWGMVKKAVIADRIALVVDRIYGNVYQHSSVDLLVATYLFAFQIYCDFSGYTDIARGSARLLGFKLTENFNKPYFAINIKDFWRRWHITFSNWLRDYIFLPRAYSLSRRIKPDKLSIVKTDYLIYAISILLTMFVCGLWHGAKWTFVVWGIIHGVFQVFGMVTRKLRKRIRPKNTRILRIFITFNLTAFAWIFFRAGSLAEAKHVVLKIFSMNTMGFSLGPLSHVAYAGTGICFLLFIEIFQGKMSFAEFLRKRGLFGRWVFYVVCFFLIVLIGVLDSGQFIYFKF